MPDFQRWQRLKYLPLESAEILVRYPVLADRSMHEIENLWNPEFAKLSPKKQLRAFEDLAWYAALPTMQKSIASLVAVAYCKEQREVSQ